jgi:hypothetical protein
MHSQRPDLVSSLSQATREISSDGNLPTVLDTIVPAVQRSLPGVDHAGISVTHKDRRVETLAATDPLVIALDELQYDLGEGPCLTAIFDNEIVTINDARPVHELNWTDGIVSLRKDE